MGLLNVNNVPLNVEIADTPAKRARGLMHRRGLAPDSGMLFVFKKPQKLSFWMKDTKIPLSIAFLSEIGQVLDIKDMEPGSLHSVASDHPAKYALEVNRGWFKKPDCRVGDHIVGTPLI